MDVVYLFDVDGTLTPPRQRIDEEFGEIFLGWVREQTKTAYLVTGSDVSKTKEQLFDAFIDQCAGVFTCSGNVFYLNNEIVYKNEIELPPDFVENLELYLEEGSQWDKKTGNHIELRPGMVNFSTIGRNASPNLRAAYSNWDKISQERADIVDYITTLYPELEVAIGGAISVDIYPKGKNKAQVVDTIQKIHGPDIAMIFVGDRNVAGGNDWPLAQRLNQLSNCKWFQVESPDETRALIEGNELFI